MNGGGPALDSRRFWARQESKFLAILRRSLEILQGEVRLPEAEVELNRRLYFCLLSATSELYPNEQLVPIAEACNQPDADDQARAVREQKRPDFQWIYRDRYESDAHRMSKQLVVECKRIGTPERSDRIFNANYIEHGVRRFVDETRGYAKGSPSAVMVGYWQSMEANDVLKEVNDAARLRSIPILILADQGWQAAAVTRLDHQLIRSFPISPFHLSHLWVDLR